jgi:sugar-specific transcriptional regulator TrmB
MKTPQLIDRLKALGFKEYESKVFIVLLKGIPMSASEIAKEAKIIRNSIYDILKSFVEKGYCNEIETNTILNYQIIDPQIILDKIEKDYRDSFQTNVSLLKDTFGELQSIYKTKSEHDGRADLHIELIRGYNQHRVAKYIDIFKNSKKSVYGMYRLRGLVSEELNELSAALIKKGGEIRSIYQPLDFKVMRNNKVRPATNEDLIRVCEVFEASGEKVKLSEIKIPNITIFDSEIVFINLTGSAAQKSKPADLIINNPDFAEHIKDLFKFYWVQSLTIDEFKKKKNELEYLKGGSVK